MKLKNKKTGEIGNLVLNINPNRESYSVLSTENGDTVCGNLVLADYDSLAELNEEWEDYEEPKVLCFINWFGEVSELLGHISDREIEKLKDTGNYFETREEAEKAVGKLKAWKRLKDKGFRFYDYRFLCNDGEPHYIEIKASIDDISDPASKYARDLRLLFGGKE